MGWFCVHHTIFAEDKESVLLVVVRKKGILLYSLYCMSTGTGK